MKIQILSLQILRFAFFVQIALFLYRLSNFNEKINSIQLSLSYHAVATALYLSFFPSLFPSHGLFH